jgi:translation initiation factor IF-2
MGRGRTIFVNVSAKEKIGIDALLEMILLQAEVLELAADPERPATAISSNPSWISAGALWPPY